MWVSKCWCNCNSMCSCVLGCMLAGWTPFCSHEGGGLAYVCNMCSVARGTRKHGVVQTRQPLNQNLARVRTRVGGGLISPWACCCATRTSSLLMVVWEKWGVSALSSVIP